MRKPTVDELLEYADREGVKEDFCRTDLFTGERSLVDRRLLQSWIDKYWDARAEQER